MKRPSDTDMSQAPSKRVQMERSTLSLDIVGVDILRKIFQYIPKQVRFFYLTTCKAWKTEIKAFREFHFMSIQNQASIAAQNGFLSLLQQFYQNHGNQLWNKQVSQLAAEGGQLECLKFAIECGCPVGRSSVFAARGGHLSCLLYLHTIPDGIELSPPFGVLSICETAAEGGHLDCLKFAFEKGCKLGNSHTAAAKFGHLDCLKYAWELNRNDAGIGQAGFWAAANGHLSCLKYTIENGCLWNDIMSTKMAENGHLECLKYAHENGCPWDQLTCDSAAENNHLECLKYAHENGCEWGIRTSFKAAEAGHIEILKYLHENGCPWNVTVCDAAANRGDLEMLKYAHENGCAWDVQTCKSAIMRKRMECLKYACENGCKLDELCCVLAELQGEEYYAYVHKMDCPCDCPR